MRLTTWFRHRAASAGAALWALSAAALAVVVLTVVLMIQATTASDLERRMDAAAVEAHETSLAGMALLQAITNAETAQRGFLLTRQARFLQPYEQARLDAGRALSALSDMTGAGPADARPDRLRQLADHRLGILERTIGLARAGRHDEALGLLGGGGAAMDELRQRLDVLVAGAQARHAAIRAERRTINQESYGLQVGLAALTALSLIIAISSLGFERATARRAETVRVRMTDELHAARHSAEEANKAKSRFLATASHDMRQPLHALALYISTLGRRVDSPQAREILANMDGAVRSMTRLFAALLDLARLEAGALKPEPVDFPLEGLLREVIAQSVDPRAGDAAGVRLVPTSVEVHSDPDLLEVILRNLTSNAVKHAKGEVLIGCRREGDFVRIEVHDNGQGIPEDQIQRLFSEFVRGAEAGSAEGIGLGLAIVERMAKLLGHPLSVRSRPDQGSVFSVTVPCATTKAAALASSETAVALEGARILVTDDEPLALDAMRHAFEDAGAQVTTAPSADRVRALAPQGFDLYVFDLNLGRDNGLRLLDELEALKGGPIAALVVTGATTPEVLDQLRKSGRRWVTKPLAAAVLTATASDVLAQGG